MAMNNKSKMIICLPLSKMAKRLWVKSTTMLVALEISVSLVIKILHDDVRSYL